jgi:hypothetical protein
VDSLFFQEEIQNERDEDVGDVSTTEGGDPRQSTSAAEELKEVKGSIL